MPGGACAPGFGGLPATTLIYPNQSPVPFYAAPPALRAVPPARTVPPATQTAVRPPARTAPVVRAQQADAPARAAPPKLTIPPPEALGAPVPRPVTELDWTALRVRLDRLGAPPVALEELPGGRHRV